MITRLITDRDIQRGLVSPPIVLDERTLLTPAGRDRAAQLGWTIIEKGAAPPVALPPAPARDRAATDPAAVPAAPVAPAASGCGCSQGGGQGACPCAKLPDGLADGTYLVRLHEGRVISVLPSTGPGQMLRSR